MNAEAAYSPQPMDSIQHIIVDDTLHHVGDSRFAEYLCHAYCRRGCGTFEWRGGEFGFSSLLHFCRHVQTNQGGKTLRTAGMNLRVNSNAKTF